MGKKGNWFSALKRALTSSSKDNNIVFINSEKKHTKEKKKWGVGRSKHAEVSSFIPLCREPSSIEKILGDAEREQQHFNRHQEPSNKVQHFRAHHGEPSKKVQHFHSPNEEPPKKLQHFHSPNDQEPPKKLQLLQASRQEPKYKKAQYIEAQKPKQTIAPYKRAINPTYVHSSAIKIQTAYRGYIARKQYRALKGLVRLQKVMRGHSVKRQTTNTMKCMQLLVRVQSQVRARRLQMIESRINVQTPRKSDKDMESSFSKWSLFPQSEAEADEEWDDSVLTKEERDTRTRRKVEAVIKRERALAYAYSHQLLKVTPKSAHAVLTDIRSGGSPWWWNWLDRQLPNEPRPRTPAVVTPNLVANFRPSSRSQAKRETSEAPTPRSSKAFPSPRAKNSIRTPNKWSHSQLRDDDSLTSCPPFRPVPNYMAPTVSAKAKVRDNQGGDGYRHYEGKSKRFSFSLTQSIGSLRWSKAKEPEPVQTMMHKGIHRPTNSIGGFSVDSAVSLPAGVGRRHFK